MTSAPTPPRGSASASPARDVTDVLAACRARVPEREGIATSVALDDAGFPVLEGRDVAELQETGARELVDTLVVLGDQHLRAVVETP